LRLEGLGKLKKSTASGTRTGDIPACSIVPQPTMPPRRDSYTFLSIYLPHVPQTLDFICVMSHVSCYVLLMCRVFWQKP
jgi:hypothetical protein